MGKMQQFKREIRSAVGKQLAFDVRSGYGAALSGLFERIGRGHKVYDSEIREMMTGRSEVDDPEGKAERARYAAGPTIVPGSKTGKFTAVLSLHGVAMYDSEWQPYCFSTLLLSQIMGRLAADPQIETIVLDIDTPGGMVTGTQEAADAVFAARRKKRVIGLVNPLCASAGYWIASQCSEIVGVPSADIGSIGVFMCHYDCSAMLADAGIKPTYIFAGEYKTEGNSSEPLTEEGKAWYQSEVDKTYSDFISAVSRGRGIKPEAVIEKFGKGRCFSAPMAKKVGMIDEISTIQGALASWGVPDLAQESNRRRSEGEAPAEAAEAQVDAAPAAFEVEEASAATNFMTQEGCEPCSFTQVTAPGVITTYAAQPWPARIAIAEELMNNGVNRCLFVVGETVTIAVANGAAVYTKIGKTANNYWICSLEPDSSYTPAPQPYDPKNASLEPSDEFKAEAAAQASRKAADAARRRLALLSA
jgi:signal peptide peptidase SppA